MILQSHESPQVKPRTVLKSTTKARKTEKTNIKSSTNNDFIRSYKNISSLHNEKSKFKIRIFDTHIPNSIT